MEELFPKAITYVPALVLSLYQEDSLPNLYAKILKFSNIEISQNHVLGHNRAQVSIRRRKELVRKKILGFYFHLRYRNLKTPSQDSGSQGLPNIHKLDQDSKKHPLRALHQASNHQVISNSNLHLGKRHEHGEKLSLKYECTRKT